MTNLRQAHGRGHSGSEAGNDTPGVRETGRSPLRSFSQRWRWVTAGIIVVLLAFFLIQGPTLFLSLVLPTDDTPIPYPTVDCQLRNWPTEVSSTPVTIHQFTTGADKLTSVMTGRPAEWTPIQAFVIERGNELIVVDPGPDRRRVGFLRDWTYNGFINHLIVPIRLQKGEDLPNQMRSAGLDPDRVSTVVLTHAHGDHTGNLDQFPNATVVIDAREKAEANKLGNRSGAVPKELAAVTNWREVSFADAPPLASYEHGLDLTGDGSIYLVEADGHGPGQLSVIVRTPSGPVLIPGDALARWEDLDERYAMPGQHDRARFLLHLAMAECFRQQDPSLAIFPGHDEPRVDAQGHSSIVLHPRVADRR